jgi:hypothetical protein
MEHRGRVTTDNLYLIEDSQAIIDIAIGFVAKSRGFVAKCAMFSHCRRMEHIKTRFGFSSQQD